VWKFFFPYIVDRYPFISFCLIVSFVTFIFFAWDLSSVHLREPSVSKRAQTNPPAMDIRYLILARNTLVFRPNFWNYFYTTGRARVVLFYNRLDPTGMSILNSVRLHNTIEIISIEGITYSGFIIFPPVLGDFAGVQRLHLRFNSDWVESTRRNGQFITSGGVPVVPDAQHCAHVYK